MRSARRPKGCWFEAMAATQKTVCLSVKLVESGTTALKRRIGIVVVRSINQGGSYVPWVPLPSVI